jgi:hypothetical protein
MSTDAGSDTAGTALASLKQKPLPTKLGKGKHEGEAAAHRPPGHVLHLYVGAPSPDALHDSPAL